MRKIKWGVIGSGGIARRRTIPEGILPASNARLTSVYGPTAATNAEVAREFGAEPARSIEALLESDVEAVYIGSPPGKHLEQVQACARAGKHVLCEKPLGITVSEVSAMIRACRSAGVRFGTAFMMRFHSRHREALRLIQEGRLGQPVFARAQLSCWYPPIPGAWRQQPAESGGGSLIDMGGHCIDLLEMYFGKIKAVSCLINRTVHAYASEDAAVATLLFENGAMGVVDSFFCIPDDASRNVLELYGTHGSIIASGTIGQEADGEMIARLDDLPDLPGYDSLQERKAGIPIPINPAPVNTYLAEIEEFSRAIIEDRDPVNNAALGLRSQEVLSACYESAHLRRQVTLGA